MKILLSGGHLTPALALMDYALAQKQEVVFVGRLYAQAQSQKSREQEEVLQRGVKFIPFSSGKLTHSLWQSLMEIPKVVMSFFGAMKIMVAEKPTIFVSFGGYLAVPLAFAAWLFRIPVVTHEQTRGSGFANKVIAHFAQAIAVSYEESLHLFPVHKTFFIGNPIRRQILVKNTTQPSWFTPKISKPLLYITGGSQGSQIINMTIWQILPKLVQDWVVIHQCGNPTKQMNYKQELEQRRKTLPLVHQNQYFVIEWLAEPEQAWIYSHAKGIIARAGANTVQEIILLAKPAIFIPLPFAHDDEQTKNAQVLAETGAAVVISQKELSGEKLLAILHDFQRHYPTMLKAAQDNQKMFDLKADQRLFELVQKIARE